MGNGQTTQNQNKSRDGTSPNKRVGSPHYYTNNSITYSSFDSTNDYTIEIFLQELKLKKYLNIFKRNNINNYDDIISLNVTKLKKIGIRDSFDRMYIMEKRTQLLKQNNDNETSVTSNLSDYDSSIMRHANNIDDSYTPIINRDSKKNKKCCCCFF